MARVWLGKRRSAEQAAAMEVQVYRLVQDEIPTYLLTRIRLNVAGDAREVAARAACCPTASRRCQLARRSARAPGARRHACACRCAPAARGDAGRARHRCREHAGAPGPAGRQVAARGNLELRRQRRAARGGRRRRRRHRSRPGQRAAPSGAQYPAFRMDQDCKAQRGRTQPRLCAMPTTIACR